VEARRGCHRRTAQCGSTDKEKWEVEYGDLKAHLLQYGRQYPKELYNIDFDKVSTEEELMDMLPKGFTPGPRETTADETGDVDR
jgi:hypothetical protein